MGVQYLSDAVGLTRPTGYELHPRYGRPEQSQRFSERRRLATGFVVSARGTRALRRQSFAGPVNRSVTAKRAGDASFFVPSQTRG